MQSQILKYVFLFILCCSSVSVSNAQVYLQIEKFGSLKTIQIFEGQTINFKTREYPKTWRSATISRILPEDNSFVMDGDIFQPEDLHAISFPEKSLAYNIGTQLQRMGLGLILYGGIADLAGWQDIAPEAYISFASLSTFGTLMKFLFRRRIFKFNKRRRLRIVDTRFFVPDGGP